MAQSKTHIVNMALAMIGEPAITDFTEDTESASLATLWYDSLRDSVLVEFPWNFAIGREQATAQATAPAWEFDLAYPLDPDCLRVVQVHGDRDLPWRVERVAGASVLVTNIASPISYRFIKRVEEVEDYSPLFVQALAARIGMDFAEPLGKSQTLIENLARLYTMKLKLARTVDSSEKTPGVVEASAWIESRGNAAAARAKLDGDPQDYTVPGDPS